MDPVRICFVCLGNICRSPTAEGVFSHLVQGRGIAADFELDSAGTSAYHIGEAPDRRSTAAARRRGIHLGGAARQFVAADFDRFDYVVAMDSSNLTDMRRLAPSPEHEAKLSLIRDWDANSRGQDVPDPYYGGPSGFDDVLDICLRACEGLLQHIVTSTSR